MGTSNTKDPLVASTFMLIQIKALKPLQAKRAATKLKIYSNFGFNDKDLSPLSKKAKTKS
jgi:hypothetical protein